MARRVFTRNINNGELSNSWKRTAPEANTMGMTAVTFGCTGFFGRYVAASTAYHKITAIQPYRHRSGLAGGNIRGIRCINDGTFGQNFSSDYEIDKEFVIKAMLEKVEHVFNCVGCWQEPTLYEHSQSWFDMEAVNVEWPRLLAKWCREMGINRMVHISHAAADHNSPSKLLRMKKRAEEAVMEEFPRATIIRTTEMFGEDDNNITRHIRDQRFWKVVPVVRRGERIVQPAFAGDVAEAMVRAIRLDHCEGRIAELGGPIRMTTNDIYRWAAQNNSQYHYTFNMPYALFKPLVYVNERCPLRRGWINGGRRPNWNLDWLDRQYVDDVATPERDPNLLDWEDFGIAREDLYGIEEKLFAFGAYWADRHNVWLEAGQHL